METITDVGGGIALTHEELGDPGGVPLLLICGLGMQLPSWPDGFCELLTSRGYLGDRTAEVAGITVPALVIHGDRDRMVNPTGGTATSRAIPGARLETIKGLGHDLPRGVWPLITGLIDGHIRAAAAGRARARSSDGQES
jgi:predicted alpha/beta-hydrolase family hydrolase